MTTHLLRAVARAVLRRWGTSDDLHDIERSEDHVCRCLHLRRRHYDDVGCDKCGCRRFRLMAATQ